MQIDSIVSSPILVDYWMTKQLLVSCGFSNGKDIGVFLKRVHQKAFKEKKSYENEAKVKLPTLFLKEFGIEVPLVAHIRNNSLVTITISQ